MVITKMGKIKERGCWSAAVLNGVAREGLVEGKYGPHRYYRSQGILVVGPAKAQALGTEHACI